MVPWHLNLHLTVRMENLEQRLKLKNSISTAQKYRELSVMQRKVGAPFIGELGVTTGDNVLDLGCGTGQLTALIAEHVGPEGKVIGVDPDEGRIRQAKYDFGYHSNLVFMEGSSEQFPHLGEDFYHKIFSNAVFHWVTNRRKAFENAYSCLKSGGKMGLVYALKNTFEDELLVALCDIFQKSKNVFQKVIFIDELSRENFEIFSKDVGFRVIYHEQINGTQSFPCVDDAVSYFSTVYNKVFDMSYLNKKKLGDTEFPRNEKGEIYRKWSVAKLIVQK